MEMPLWVHLISPARNALLFEASFHEATPGIISAYSALAYSSALAVSGELTITLSPFSTVLPPCDHRHQCTQVLPSPEACQSAKLAGVLFFFMAFPYSSNPSCLSRSVAQPTCI